MSEKQTIEKPNGAPAPVQEEPKPKTLVQKLCEVMGAVGYTQKTGWNEAQKYHYVTEADIAEKIRPELAKRNVIILPTMVSHERTQLTRPMKDYVKTSYATDVVMRWTITDGDTGEQFVCDMPGCSESPGDKGVYVAITGSEKYLLMKLFLLPTGDDPEDDSNEPAGTKEAAKAVGAAKVAELKAKKAEAVTALFYVMPESHRGNYAEFLNIREFIASHQDLEDTLRMAFTAHKAKKTRDETALVPAGELPGLLEKLAGEVGVTVKLLEAR